MITAFLLVGAIASLHAVSRREKVPLHAPLKKLPTILANWHGSDSPLEPRIVKALSVDDYINRTYLVPGEATEVQLYIGYYQEQRTNGLIHSPKHCLPGSGWQPIRTGYLRVQIAPGTSIEVNDYLISKGLYKELVLYWYQGRGRTIASEYWGKYWMAVDAVTRNRTDAALVRLVTPVNGGGEERAQARAVSFLQSMYPYLGRFLPD